MNAKNNSTSRGLEDVIAVQTRLSRVDGQAGELIIAGHRVERLAAEHSLEEVCHLLWHGELPTPDEVADLRRELGQRRVRAYERLVNDDSAAMDDPMDALRSSLARFESTGDLVDDAMTMVAAVPVANALWWNHHKSQDAPAPDAAASTPADYLHMVTGEQPSDAAIGGLQRYLVTVSDHGMNASTFTARVIASTRSDLISAVVGAVGALKGPLHGGAPGPVLDMLDAIGEPANAEAWLRNEMDHGRRIMGMGHRVYRVRDPRAAVFEQALSEFADRAGSTERLELARAIENCAEDLLAEKYPERNLKANVEFYTAVLLETVGLPRELFSPTFAAGRVAGWTAHVLEQRNEDKLIRPRSEYVGVMPQ